MTPIDKDKAKQAFKVGQNPNEYAKFNETAKKAYWSYGVSQGIVDADRLNPQAKAEYQKYYSPSYIPEAAGVKTSNKAVKDDMSISGYSFKPVQEETGGKNYDRFATMQPYKSTPIQQTQIMDNRRLLNAQRLEELTPIPTPIKPQLNRNQPIRKNERAGTFDKNKEVFDPIRATGGLALNTLSTVNSLLQTPATLGKYGTQEMEKAKAEGKNPIGGLLKGYATGLGKAITNQDAVENTEVLEGVAPKTTAALKQKFPNAYNAASTVVNLLGVDDLTAWGLLGDIAKARKLSEGMNTTADLVKMSQAGIKDAGKVVKIMQENPDIVKTVDNLDTAELNDYFAYIDYMDEVNRKTPEYIKSEARLNVPRAKEIKTLTKEVAPKVDEYTEEYLDSIGFYEKQWRNQANSINAPKSDILNTGGVGDVPTVKITSDTDYIPRELDKQQTVSAKAYRGRSNEDKGYSGVGRYGNGKYYTNSPKTAEIFAKNRGEGAYVEEAEVVLRKPFVDYDPDKTTEEYKKLFELLEKQGISEKLVEFNSERKRMSIFNSIAELISKNDKPRLWKGSDKTSDLLKEAGYDGIIGETRDLPELPNHIEIVKFDGGVPTKPPLQPLQPPKLEGKLQPLITKGQTLKPNKPILSALDARVNKPYDAPISKSLGSPTKTIGELKPQGVTNTLPIENKLLKGQLNKADLAKGKPKGKIRTALSKAYSATVNNTQTTANVSKEAEIMNTVARNAGATVDTIIKKGLVNMEGQKIEGKAIADIFNMPKNEAEALEQLLFETHNIDRVKQAKELTSHTTEESRLIIENVKKQYPHLEAKAKEVNTLLTNLLDEWGVKSGLVDTDLRNVLRNMYQNYVPGYRELPGVGATSLKSRGMGPAKIINKAIGGDDKLMSLQKSIPMMINKMVKSARKNELYREILKAAETGSDYAKILEPAGKIEEVLQKNATDSIIEAIKADGIDALANITDGALTADPKLGYLLTVMDNGKPIKLQIKEELFKSLQALNGKGDDDLQAALKLFKKTVTNPFKSLITGYNPMFAVRNVARDIPTAYIQGTENNPIKFARNLLDAGKDMVKKSDGFNEYKALGGEGGNYFNVEKGVQPDTFLKGKLEKPLKALGAINNFTETLPRYAEYKGTLKREGADYATKMKALHNAQEVTVNFGRHGDVVKAIDAIVPYFNPAVQGLDKTRKTFLKPEAWAKALGVITVPTAAVYAMNQIIDKKGYDQLDNRSKDTYYMFPMGNGKFIKIPKTRESGAVFGALFERILRQVEGQPEAFKNYGSTFKTNFLVQNPWTDNIASPFVSGIGFNKDFAGRNVVPTYMLNDKRSPKLQYDERTSEIAKEIGDKFNMSPKQIDYIMKSYGGIVASIVIPATTKGGNVVETVIKRPFTADAAYSNEITNDFYGKLDKLKQAATDKNIKGNLPSKLVTPEEKMSNLYAGMTRSISDIRDGITKLGSTDEAREKQQKLLGLLTELNKDIGYRQADKLKAYLNVMAKEYKK